MNQEYAQLNKTMQDRLKREATFPEGIDTLLTLRQKLMEELNTLKETLSPAEFRAMPFPSAKGYHSKTIAYSIWHIFRMEDIVVNSLILGRDEVFLAHQEAIGAPIITTGNELAGEEITAFSEALDLEALYRYADAVKRSTEEWLRQLSHRELRRRFGDADKARLQSLRVVSDDERAAWLLDYWCGKSVEGLIRMPLSRHWIMHVEASLRIADKLAATPSAYKAPPGRR